MAGVFSILDRYIGKTILVGTGLALFLVVGLDALFTLIDQLRHVGDGGYTFATAAYFVALSIPWKMSYAMPMATLIGSIMSLGVMAGHSELVVMRAAGLSIGRIVFGVLKTGLIIALVTLFVAEYVAPYTQEKSVLLVAQAKSGQATLPIKGGFWAKDDQDFIHVLAPKSADDLQGVNVYRFDQAGRLLSTMQAKKARVTDEGWQLQNVLTTNIGDSQITHQQHATLLWPSKLQPRHLEVVVVDPATLALRELYQYVDYLKQNGLDAGRYQFEFWSKLFAPFTNMLMLMLAVPFVFGSLRSANAGQRLLAGIVVGVVYYVTNLVAGQIATIYGLYPLLAATVSPLAFTVLALWLIRRVR